MAPIPYCEASILDETSNNNAVPAANFNPAKIVGSVPGKITLQMTFTHGLGQK
jgi:hypothetical protein